VPPTSRKNDLEEEILKFLVYHPEGITASYVAKVLAKSRGIQRGNSYWETFRKNVYRTLEKLVKKGAVISEKISHNYKIYRLVCAKHTIDLIDELGHSKIQTKLSQLCDLVAHMDKEPNHPRLRALKRLTETIMLSEEDKAYLYEQFFDYIDDTNDRRLFFRLREVYLYDPEDPNNYLILPYLHRFNNPTYWKKHNQRVRWIFQETAKRYKWATHLTLTIDPFRHESNADITVIAKKQINSFLTNLRQENLRKKGEPLEYVCFAEFTKKGIIHFHIIIFGRRWIRKVKEIAEKMWKLGYVWAYQLTVRNGKWVYPRKKPPDYQDKLRRFRENKDGLAQDGGQFMGKDASVYFYFAYPNTIGNGNGEEREEGGYRAATSSDYDRLDDYYLTNFALLWAYNSRAMTHSRSLTPPKNEEEMKEPQWEFIGSFYWWYLEDIVDNMGLLPALWDVIYDPFSRFKSPPKAPPDEGEGGELGEVTG